VQREQVREIYRRIHSVLTPSLRVLRYIVRDFQYSTDQIEKEREELQTADTAEKELWVSSPLNNHSLN
jgi:V-type H+-transporting ATPase subunit C